MALAAGLRESGVPIETAGTAMSQLMVRMASKRDSGAFAKLAGRNTKDFQQTLVGSPLEAITQVAGGLGKMGKLEAEQFLDQLHLDGQRVRGTLLQLVAILPKLEGFVKASEEDWSSLSAVQKGYNIQSATTTNQLKLMWANVALLKAEMGRGLLPIIKGFVDGMIIWTENTRRFFDRNRESIEAMGKSIGKFFTILGAATQLKDPFMAWFGAAAKEKFTQYIQILKNGIGMLGDFMGDIFAQAAKHFGVALKNAFLDRSEERRVG